MFALLALSSGHIRIFAGYLLWVMLSRVAHSAISWWHGRRFSAYYIPLQIISDWVIALTKVWILFHPAKQTWLNRGARTLDTTRNGGFYRLRSMVAHYLYGFSCVMTIILVGLYSGFLSVLHEMPLFVETGAAPVEVVALFPPETKPGIVMFGAEPETKGATTAGSVPEVSVNPVAAIFPVKMFSYLEPGTPVTAHE
jgi:hypothetical protein